MRPSVALIHRTIFAGLAVLASCALLGCTGGPPPEKREPPPKFHAEIAAPAQRVVLVTIDTLRADYVGCYGSKRVRTRTLDALARRGARFETAIAPTPLTLPSHTSILTGLDPVHHGVHANGTFELGDGIPTLAERFQSAGFATAAFVAAAVLDRRYGLARGFDLYHDDMGFRRTVPSASGVAERRADEVLDDALAWAEGAPERFFLWVHLYDPHANYDPPRGFAKPPKRPPPDPAEVGFLKAAAAALPARYAGEIYYTDTELGRLIRELDRRFDDGRTLYVVTSDHGESLGEHGELTHSLTIYDATQRVPLLMVGPGVPTGRVVTAPVRLIDVAPTILSLAELPPLGDHAGEDLGPWLRGQRNAPLDAYVETLSTQVDYGWSAIYGLRTDHHKYLRTTRPELYDLVRDPAELRDLAGEEPGLVSNLDARLEERLAGGLPVVFRPLPTDEERAMLESLGYVVPSSPREQPPLGHVGGPDPKDRLVALVLLAEANTLLAAGRVERAREVLDRAPEAGGWIAHARAEVALELGDDAGAERAARAMVEAQPAYAEGYLILGRALEHQGRVDEARLTYETATGADPSQSESIVALGRLEEREGDLDAAAAAFRQALATRVPSTSAALRLAALLFDEGRGDEALALLEGLDARRAPSEDLVRLARAEAAAGRREPALARVDRALKTSPNSAPLQALRTELAE